MALERPWTASFLATGLFTTFAPMADHSSDEAPEAFVVHVTHGNVLIGFIRLWRHAAASFPEGLDYIQSSLHFFSVPPYSGQDELAETNFFSRHENIFAIFLIH